MSRFSGISLNDGRRGYFSLSISSCSTVYESLVSKAVDKAGDGLGKTEGQMRGILCGFYLITISVGELLPTVDPTIFSGIAYGIFFFASYASRCSAVCAWAVRASSNLSCGGEKSQHQLTNCHIDVARRLRLAF